jgi:hypothetical protein
MPDHFAGGQIHNQGNNAPVGEVDLADFIADIEKHRFVAQFHPPEVGAKSFEVCCRK